MNSIGLLLVLAATMGIVYLLITQDKDKEDGYISPRCGNCKYYDGNWHCTYFFRDIPPDFGCHRWKWVG